MAIPVTRRMAFSLLHIFLNKTRAVTPRESRIRLMTK